MKSLKKVLLLIAMVFPLAIFAQSTETDVTNPFNIVAILTPFIVYAVTELWTRLKPMLPGWILGLLVPGLSTLFTWLTNELGNPDVSWWAQIGLGLAATFIHQVIKNATSSK